MKSWCTMCPIDGTVSIKVKMPMATPGKLPCNWRQLRRLGSTKPNETFSQNCHLWHAWCILAYHKYPFVDNQPGCITSKPSHRCWRTPTVDGNIKIWQTSQKMLISQHPKNLLLVKISAQLKNKNWMTWIWMFRK
jgi:hypothetical protein